jgi:filamentous hemagglutinin family protein
MLITKFSQMAKIGILTRSIFTLGILSGFTIPASAQITPATTGTGSTTVNPSTTTANTTDIQGGQKSSDNKNLFHSFGTFNVKTGEVANFKPDDGIQNILGRVTGGTPSLIDGKLQVNGGVINPPAVNLFLMNPAGIVFGKGASLDINGAFTATTAKAIDLNGKWFNAVGTNNYSELTGNPLGLAFPGSTPGSIFSAATLSNVQPGKSITLVGGTVISTGDIKTAGGNISISTVEGGKYVQIKSDGSLLRLDLPASATSIAPDAKAFTALSLPELLTNTKVDLAATGVKNENGVVTLVGNPPAVAALIPDLDKAIAANNKALTDYDKVRPSYDKALEDYNKALAATGGKSELVDPAISNAYNVASNSLSASNTVLTDSYTALFAIKKKFDALVAVGDSRAVSDAIALGDTVSKQNRSISSGDVITRNLDTSSNSDRGAANVHIESSQSILTENINTNRLLIERTKDATGNKYYIPLIYISGGDIVLNAQNQIKTNGINSSNKNSFDSQDGISRETRIGGNITLLTQSGDIIVDAINSSNGSKYRGGNISVQSGGLFRVITGGINAEDLGKIKITHHGTSFVSGFTVTEFVVSRDAAGKAQETRFNSTAKPGFTFPDGASGSRGLMYSTIQANGSAGIIYTDQGFISAGGLSLDGYGIATLPRIDTKNDPNKNSDTGKKDSDLATKPSGDNSEEKDPKNSAGASDDQASKPGDSEEDKQKAKKRKQKAKCSNNSSAIASAKLGTDPTRSGNSTNLAAEEFCLPNSSGILQILTDRN